VSEHPLADMSAALRHLHRQAGEPSTREIGGAIKYSHTTVAQALGGSRRCSWKVIEKIVVYLNGDVEIFRRLWVRMRDAEAPLPPLPNLQIPPSARLNSGPLYPVQTADQRQQSSPIPQKDERVEIIVDPRTGTRRFLVPPAIAREWIRDLGQEESSNDEA
jgi:hypothetical protein